MVLFQIIYHNAPITTIGQKGNLIPVEHLLFAHYKTDFEKLQNFSTSELSANKRFLCLQTLTYESIHNNLQHEFTMQSYYIFSS